MWSPENVIHQIHFNLETGGYTKTREGEEPLPADWDCTRVTVLECKEGGLFKVRLLADPDRNWPPDCEGEFETLYDWRGLRHVAKAWRGATLVKDRGQCMLEEDMDLFDFPTDGPVELFATWRVPRGIPRDDVIAMLGKMIAFHDAEVARVREILFDAIVPAEERARYRAQYGFDPVADRQYQWGTYGGEEQDRVDGGPLDLYRYEVWLPLDADPLLMEQGVEIGARTKVMIVMAGEDFLHKEEVSFPCSEVVFRHRGAGAVGIIWCAPDLHPPSENKTRLSFARDGVMYRVTGDAAWKHSRMSKAYEEGSEDEERLFGAERRILAFRKGDPRYARYRHPPWAHFAALKAFVMTLASEGIEHFLLQGVMAAGTPGARWQLGDDPWPSHLVEAYEACIFSAIAHAKPRVAARFGRDILLRLAARTSKDWFFARGKIFEEIFLLASRLAGNTPNGREWRNALAEVLSISPEVVDQWITDLIPRPQ